MQILLGVADFGETEEKMLLMAARESGLEITSCERRYTKAGIMQYLAEHPETDVVILSEAVEGTAPFTAQDYEVLSERHEGVRVIPILMDERCGTGYIRDVFFSGIYNAIFSSDADMQMVLRLMSASRSRKEAKMYYRLPDADDVSNDANIDRCVRHICDAQTEVELKERVVHIHKMLTKAEFVEVIENLDAARRDAVRAIPEFKDLVPEEPMGDAESTIKGGILSSIASAISGADRSIEQQTERIRQPDPVSGGLRMNALSVDDLFNIISNVIVGFVGNQRRSGVTHQAITAAHYLAARGYRVAVADCSAHGGKSMTAFEAIEKYRDALPLAGGFSYLGVDYYKSVTTESLNKIFSSEKQYHFVLIDYGTFSPYVKADIGRCSIKCAVCGSMPWEVNQLRAFADDTRFLSGQIVYLVRGVAESARDKQDWLADIVENYRFADVQEDPFDGTCYPALAELFDKYVKGLPIQNNVRSEPVTRVNSVSVPTTTSAGEVLRPARKFGANMPFFRREHTADVEPAEPKERVVPNRRGKTVNGVWFFAELKHGAGCSYVAAVTANLLAECTGSICLITDGDNEDLRTYVSGSVYILTWAAGIDSAFAEYDAVVMDAGVVRDMNSDRMREMARAARKYMVCRSGEDYMRNLAEFASGDENEGSGWSYVFNQIPPADHGKVKRLMDVYDICFLPLGDAKRPSREMKKSLSALIFR